MFAYPSTDTSGGARYLELYHHSNNGQHLHKPPTESTQNYYTVDGNTEPNTLRIPNNVFVTGDLLYLQTEQGHQTATVTFISGDLVSLDTDVENVKTASLDQIEPEGESKLVFVGVSAPIRVRQYRLAENIVVIPTIISGKATICLDPTGFHVGDPVCIQGSTDGNETNIQFGTKGDCIGVFVSGDPMADPPTSIICIKNSLFPVTQQPAKFTNVDGSSA